MPFRRPFGRVSQKLVLLILEWSLTFSLSVSLAIYNFHVKGLYQLELQLGETVEILEESAGEYFATMS